MDFKTVPLKKAIELIDNGEIEKEIKPLSIIINKPSYDDYINLSKEERIQIREKLNANREYFLESGVNLFLEKITDFKPNKIDLGTLNEYMVIFTLFTRGIYQGDYMGLAEFQDMYERIFKISKIIKKQSDENFEKSRKEGLFKNSNVTKDALLASFVVTHIIKRIRYYDEYADFRVKYYNNTNEEDIELKVQKRMNRLSALEFYRFGIGVCKEISIIFKCFMDIFNIECQVLRGKLPNGVGHMWNRVNIDGQWYVLDITDVKSEKIGVFKPEELFTSEQHFDVNTKINNKELVINSNIEKFIKICEENVIKEDYKYLDNNNYLYFLKEKSLESKNIKAEKNYPNQKVIAEFMHIMYNEIILDDELSDDEFKERREAFIGYIHSEKIKLERKLVTGESLDDLLP